jgi:hypothetical protein
MPRDRIQTILEGQILPGFAQVFTQLEEGLGPDGVGIDDWLKSVTHEMQGSIEKHLSKVFRE